VQPVQQREQRMSLISLGQGRHSDASKFVNIYLRPSLTPACVSDAFTIFQELNRSHPTLEGTRTVFCVRDVGLHPLLRVGIAFTVMEAGGTRAIYLACNLDSNTLGANNWIAKILITKDLNRPASGIPWRVIVPTFLAGVAQTLGQLTSFHSSRESK
jgi:hypothetical protein